MTERKSSPSASSPDVEELRDALAARDELIAVMGHELRNAMAPLVLLAAQFELMPATDDMMKKKVAMLSRNLKTFTGTLDRIGEVSQLRAGKLELELAPADLAEVVRDACNELAPLSQASHSEITCEVESVVGHWDRARLEQIVKHLLGNAIRHAAGTPVTIRVRAAGDHAELEVEDHGPGIAAHERDRLFDRFDRTSGSRRRGGLGVGLWVVKSLCQAMGGSVWLADTTRGARFCVTLPRG